MERKKTSFDIPGLNKLPPKVSGEIMKKLGWFDYYENCGKNARLTCRHFGISPDTFYRWKKRYDPNNPLSLVDDKKTRRPKRLRQPTTPPPIVDRIRDLKKAYPAWSGNKLSAQLRNEGVSITATTVRRIINRLKNAGILDDPSYKANDKRKGITTRHGYRVPTGYHAYLSLLQMWKQ